jgi:hypothetical protein
METSSVAREAIGRAGAALRSVTEAFRDPQNQLDALALQLQSIAADLGYEHYASWMRREVGGYGSGTLGEMLAVPEDSPLPERVASYRRKNGQVVLQVGSKQMELQYPWFFGDPVSKLQSMANRHAIAPAEVVITIPPDQIPFDEIRTFIVEKTREKVLRVGFTSSVYPLILVGLRQQLLSVTSELVSAHKMLEGASR